jgi:hypothetical protein
VITHESNQHSSHQPGMNTPITPSRTISCECSSLLLYHGQLDEAAYRGGVEVMQVDTVTTHLYRSAYKDRAAGNSQAGWTPTLICGSPLTLDDHHQHIACNTVLPVARCHRSTAVYPHPLQPTSPGASGSPNGWKAHLLYMPAVRSGSKKSGRVRST